MAEPEQRVKVDISGVALGVFLGNVVTLAIVGGLGRVLDWW